MKPRLYASAMIAVFVACAFSGYASGQASRSSPAKPTKTEKILKDAGAVYRPFQDEKSFIVSYKGKEMKQIDLIVVEAENAVAILVDVAAGKEVTLTPAVMRQLLEFSVSADYIKVGISDIDSIRVQTEQSLTISAKAFGEVLDQVAAGADDVARILAPVKKKTVAEN